jgi:hypothetical protein
MAVKCGAQKILQILSAEGWRALYKDAKGPEFAPLDCWALLEEEGRQRVTGMVACNSDGSVPDYIDFAEGGDGFGKYCHASESSLGTALCSWYRREDDPRR